MIDMSSSKRAFSLVIVLFFFCSLVFAQNQDSIKTPQPLKASANIQFNTNGISLFPNLSLGRPALILNIYVGKMGVFFEPEFRWGLDGKPWSYIYWLRYKFRKSEKFGLNIGGHPAYVIKQADFSINGKLENRYYTLRNIAGEIAPTYYFSKKFALGIYYLRSWGSDKNYGTQKGEFISLQPKLPNIKVSEKYYLALYPQIFHLKLDDKQGIYLNETLSINRKDFPINFSSIFTYRLKSSIPGDNIVWNVGLNFKL